MFKKFLRFRERYWSRVSIAIIVLCWATFIIGSQVDIVSKKFISTGAVQLIILTVVLELGVSTRDEERGPMRVSGRDSEASTMLMAAVADKSINSADMLEFSGVAVDGLIHDIASRGGRVRLLVKHPDSVMPFQKRRIIANLEALLGRDYGDRLSIRCYKFPASLRGRVFGDEAICLGWYTPFIEGGHLAQYEVMGHDNALIMARLSTTQGRSLERMFKSVFESLWSADGTEDASQVVTRYSAPEPGSAGG